MTSPGSAYADLPDVLAGTELASWGNALADLGSRTLASATHGDLPRWLAAVKSLPQTATDFDLDLDMPRLGGEAQRPDELAALLMQLHPWRKGPLELGGTPIDTEWRSDWKWKRLKEHIDVQDELVLDIGCGNGYFGWRLLGAGARCVIGIDPTMLFVMQWLAQRHFVPQLANFVLPLRDTDLPEDLTGFDRVMSMGVLYHRREPEDHMRRLMTALRPGGALVLETLVLDQAGTDCLVPEARYARMRNVWQIPAIGRLAADIEKAGFEDVELADVTPTSTAEQRSTPWMKFESLQECLDPSNPEKTIEGLPAPVRAIFTATKASV